MEKGRDRKTVLLFNPLLILDQMHSCVNTPLVLCLTQIMCFEKNTQKIKLSENKFKTDKKKQVFINLEILYFLLTPTAK